MIVLISSEASILSKRAFSTFRILPRSGRIAWNFRSRPCLAVPPARVALDQEELGELGVPLRAVGELAGEVEASSAPLRRVSSRALRAASRARAASTHFSMIRRAIGGFSSKKVPSLSFTTCCTQPLTSEETSLSLVCDENLGSWMRTETTAVSPSRTSSPESVVSLSCLASPELCA